MRSTTVVLLIVLGIITGAVITHYVRQQSIREFEREVEAKELMLDSLKAIIYDDSVKLDTKKKEIKEQRDSLNALIKRARVKQIALGKEVKALSDSIENQLPDHLRPAFYRLRKANEQRVALLEAEIVARDSIIVSQDTLIDMYFDLNRDLHQALREETALKDYWREKAKRSPWEKPWFTGASAALGVIAGYVVSSN
jgi:hypothetical protein